MNDEVRKRLKLALIEKDRTAADVCRKLEYSNDKYLSRVIAGHIASPSAERLQEIAGEIGVSLTWIMTGSDVEPEKDEFLRRLANESDEVVNEVARYVRDRGLMKS